MATRTLQIEIVGDPSSFSRATRRVGQDADRMGRDVEKSGRRMSGFATVTTKGMGAAKVAAGGLATAGGAAAAVLAKSFVEGATAIDESLSKNRILFGQFAESVDKFSKTSATSFGISRKAALEYTGVFGNLFRSTGLAREESAKFSTNLTKLASDMASFNNTSIEDALEAIRSGLVGESEPLRRFGVNINDAQLKTEALRQGLIKSTKEGLDPQTKALAAQGLIFKQTKNAQGDFQRTSEGLANQQRILRARLDDAAASLGAKLMPAALSAVRAVNSLFDSSSKGGRAVGALGRATQDAADWMKTAWKDAVAAIGRFADRNREDINQVIRAFRNLGRFAKNVFEDVLIPVVKRVLPVLRGVMEGMVTSLRGVIRVITGIVNGDWRRVWEGVKDIARGAVRAIGTILKGLWKAFRDTIKALVPLSLRLSRDIGKAIVKGIISGIKAAPSAIADAISGLIPGGGGGPPVGRFGKIGEGIGKKIGTDAGALPSGKGAGSLMGARAGMKPFAAVGAKFGLGVVSGLRPGAITSSGNPSWHGTGEALDLGGPPAGMLAFFRYMKKGFGSRLAELIHTPGGAGISRGQSHTFTGQVAADHYDHVHIAYDLGRPGQGDGIGKGPRRRGDGLGKYVSSAYGPPWNAMQGMGVTATGVDLRPARQAYGIAVDPGRLKLGRNYYVWPNPFARRGTFKAFDTGGAIKGNRIDFYDWRGRSKQLGWGMRSVQVSTTPFGGSGSGGGGGGGGSGPQVAAGKAGGSKQPVDAISGDASLPTRGLGYAGGVAAAQRTQIIGTARNNTATVISGLQAERKLKRGRLKRIRAVLKTRITPKRRKRLAAEELQLIEEIGTIGAALREYAAEAAAKGAAAAEADAEQNAANLAADQEAAAAEADRIANLPTREDYINAQLAEAGLTPGTEDDRAALAAMLGLRTEELAAARASGDPRRISAAIQAWQAATEALNGVDDSAQRLTEAMTGLKDEMKRQNDIYESVVGVSSREAVKAMADIVSGQIVGVGLQGRRQTAGTGATVLIP